MKRSDIMTINYSAKTIETIKTMHDAVNAAENARKAGLAYAGKGELLDTAKAAVKAANEAITRDAVDAFCGVIKTQGTAAFIRAYFADWTADGFRVVQDSPDDGAAIHTDNSTLRVTYSAIDGVCGVQIASNPEWKKYLQIYADNCLAHIGDSEEGEAAVITNKTALPSDLVGTRDRAVERGATHWGKHSHSALVQQLNDLCKMVFPVDAQPSFHMVSADQRAITAAMVKGKRQNGMSATTLQLSNLRTMEAILFTEIYTRMNNLAINLDSGFKSKDATPDKHQPKADESKGGDIKGATPAAEKPAEKPKKAKANAKDAAAA